MTATHVGFLAGQAMMPPSLGWQDEARCLSEAEWGWGEIAQFPYSEENVELWPYRERTVGLLRRYMRLSVETGRLPSLLGREFFRARVTSYQAATFEDVVIFVHDIERSLEKLDRFEQQLIAKIVLQEYSQWEAARHLNVGLRTVERCFPDAVDELTRIFLRGGILEPMIGSETMAPETCQEGETEENFASCWNEGE